MSGKQRLSVAFDAAVKMAFLSAFMTVSQYIKAAGISEDAKSPLFRSALGRTGSVNGEAMHRIDAYRMIPRRAAPSWA